MSADKVKQLVAAGITFGTLAIPGFSDWLHAVGGQAEVLTLTGALYVVIHGIVEKLHAKVTAPMIVAALVVLAPSAVYRRRTYRRRSKASTARRTSRMATLMVQPRP